MVLNHIESNTRKTVCSAVTIVVSVDLASGPSAGLPARAQGDVEAGQVHKSLAEIRRKQGVRFIDWAPASIQVAAAPALRSVCGGPPSTNLCEPRSVGSKVQNKIPFLRALLQGGTSDLTKQDSVKGTDCLSAPSMRVWSKAELDAGKTAHPLRYRP